MTNSPRVLIVEDDTVLKNLLAHELASTYALSFASDGEEALEVFEKERPALVLLDLVMPKLDGFAVLERIRARTDDAKNTPIVVLSNLSQPEDETRARTLGATDYLVKANTAVEEIIAQVKRYATPAA